MGYTNLEWLVSPHDASHFLDDMWEKKPLLIRRGTAGYYGSLLSLKDIDEVLTSPSVEFPEIRLTKLGAKLEASDYTHSGSKIDAVAVCKLYADGATVILDKMNSRIKTLRELCQNLGRELGIRFQTNLYLTPPRSGGFDTHFDTHDVFVLQICGSKKWELFESSFELPMPGQHHDEPGFAPAGPVTATFELHEGDLLYIPRGVYHRAESTGELSLHITLGAHTRSWGEFLIESLGEVIARDVSFRRGLPIGFETGRFKVSEAREQFSSLLRRFADGSDFDKVAASFADEFSRTSDIPLEGQLLRTIEFAKIDDSTVVQAREPGNHLVSKRNETVSIHYGASVIEFPGRMEDSVSDLLSGRAIRIGDLRGNISMEDRIEIVRRTAEAGLTRFLLAAAGM
ncbi:cupin domain-containing protein [Bradyrhizobium sp. Cp5.3]|uniref:cupin domain-containing protein n=1 Tax=Bradyrhizobium sp. Cp5.3 TaxID=443598 RepID=UPI000416F0AB|nr:cupin domain-containing protein [Bradyrhizobium sp. Cp5.3]